MIRRPPRSTLFPPPRPSDPPLTKFAFPLQLPRLFAEFHVPVSQINEVLPAIVMIQREIDLHEWTPLRLLRLAHRSEEHTSELQSQSNLVCRLLLEKKKKLDS